MEVIIPAIIQGLCYAAMAFGIYLTLRIFNIPDITTDGSYTLGGVVAAILISNHWHPAVALPIVLAAGALAGVATGLIHTQLKLHPLLAGILVMTSLYSINLFIMGRPNIPLINEESIFNGSASFNMLLAAMFSIILLLLLFWLMKTDFGIAMRATGSNELMVKAMGININLMKIAGLAIANALTALSGYLMVQYQGFADINMGIGIVIAGLAAVILGESFAVFFKSSSIFSALITVLLGSVLFRLLLAFALLAGVPPQMLKLLTAVLVLLAAGVFKFIFKPAQ
ncbi:MAG: ABC transporter permease [Bacteroidota bacterium]|nr:MAG: ABC transporter permease [Bacteroidota bacterium]